MNQFKILIASILFILFSSSLISQSKFQPSVRNLTDSIRGNVGGMSIDAMGQLYVADFLETVWKISPWGEVQTITNAMYGASGNALDSKGNLFQSNFFSNTISKINRSGEIEEIASTGLNGPVGIAISNENQYVCNCNDNTIKKVSENGAVENFSTSNLFSCPNGITVGPGGNFYVVNFRNNIVVKIDSAGIASEFIKLPSSTGGHITYVRGFFYFTSFQDHKVMKANGAGTILWTIGTGEKGNNNGLASEATFSNPNGIVAIGDKVYVNDKLFNGAGGPGHTIIREITVPSLSVHLQKALNAGNDIMEAYNEFKTDSYAKNINTEIETNIFGYTMMNTGRIHLALPLFKVNTIDYPNSANVWDSLAEAYMRSGKNEEAIKNYKKSLELNSKNTNAEAMLKKLQGGK